MISKLRDYKGYKIFYVYGHYEIYKDFSFIFSSDTLEEAKQEIDTI